MALNTPLLLQKGLDKPAPIKISEPVFAEPYAAERPYSEKQDVTLPDMATFIEGATGEERMEFTNSLTVWVDDASIEDCEKNAIATSTSRSIQWWGATSWCAASRARPCSNRNLVRPYMVLV